MYKIFKISFFTLGVAVLVFSTTNFISTAKAAERQVTCFNKPYSTIIVDGTIFTEAGNSKLLKDALATANSSVYLCGGWYHLTSFNDGFHIGQDGFILRGFATPYADGYSELPMINIHDFSGGDNDSALIDGNNVLIKNMRFQVEDTLEIRGENVQLDNVTLYQSSEWDAPVLHIDHGASLSAVNSEVSVTERPEFTMISIDGSAQFQNGIIESGDIAINTGADCQTFFLDAVYLTHASIIIDGVHVHDDAGTTTYAYASEACGA